MSHLAQFPRHALAIAVALLALATACHQGPPDLRAVRDQACACQNKACAAAVGVKLSKVVMSGELDEARAKLAIEATTCLAAFGE